jgi:biopolymer transport protein ExbD
VRIHRQRPGDGHALLLAAGELGGEVIHLVAQTDSPQLLFGDGLLLPSPQMDDPNMAKEVESNQLDIPNRILVNVLLKEASDPARIGEVKEYRIGAKKVEKDDLNMEFKKQRDIARAAKCTELFVDIRADRSIKYEHIAPVLTAAASVDSADVKVKLNIAALRPTARPVEFGK